MYLYVHTKINNLYILDLNQYLNLPPTKVSFFEGLKFKLHTPSTQSLFL